MDKIFSKERMMMLVLERVKYDIEKCFPDDKESLSKVNDLLYSFAWKVAEQERTQLENNVQ